MIYAAIEYFLIALTVVSIGLCVWRGRNFRIAAALIIVMPSAILSSKCGSFLLMGASLIVAFGVCVISLRSGDGGMLDIESNELCYAIGFILMIRLPFVMLYAAGVVGFTWLWLSSVIFLMLENLLIIEGYANGRSGRINDRITNFRIRADEFIFSRSRV